MIKYDRDSLLWLTLKSDELEDMEDLVNNSENTDEIHNHNSHQQLHSEKGYYLREPLQDILKKEHDVYLFLIIFGIIWYDNKSTIQRKGVSYAWNLFCRFCLILCPLLIFINFLDYLFRNHIGTISSFLEMWSLDLIFILQSIALLWSLMKIKRRLMSISTDLEVSYFQGALKYVICYFCLTIFPTLLYPILHVLQLFRTQTPDDQTEELPKYRSLQLVIYFILPICEVIILQFLSVHMLFILVDIQVLWNTFNRLSNQFEEESDDEDYSKYKLILEEIYHRVKSSLYETIPIIITAFAEISILITLVIQSFSKSNYSSGLSLIFLFLKEIIFLVMMISMIIYYNIKVFHIRKK